MVHTPAGEKRATSKEIKFTTILQDRSIPEEDVTGRRHEKR